MIEKHGDREPKSIMGMQYSMPFSVAIALVKDIADPWVFNEETLWDGDVRGLAKRVELVLDQRAGEGGGEQRAQVTIEVGGKRHILDVEDYTGSPTRPFTFDGICDKFRRYSTRVIGEKRAGDIIEKVKAIEQLSDIADLARLVGAWPVGVGTGPD